MAHPPGRRTVWLTVAAPTAPGFVQDLNLPRSIITRLAKGVLPPNTQIQANAILAMTKGATVFISHLANAYVPYQAPCCATALTRVVPHM